MSTLGRLLLSVPFGALLLSSSACVEYPKCKNDEHCVEKGEVCVAGFCKKCKDNSQCGKGQECTASNTCEYRAGYCDEGRPCYGNQKCRDNQCGPQCLNNGECAANQFCSEGACVVKPECGVNADRESCDEGFDCQGGRCVRRMVECRPSAPIYFDFDKHNIKRSEEAKLKEVAACLRNDNASRVTLGGHADDVGSTEYNLALGDSRASSVREFLGRLGVSTSLLNTTSYGEDRPAVEGSGRQPKNRRVEFDAR
jgi:peptidoglycan-associated lipoprotein